ncbi:uncharacterized protein [Malus domestica]|uniref:uncharacterized protein isoform X1 n=1 Tax=Malus domestica TaxID=3750 RepID=UPI0010A9C25D|nr:uncharacterized protein LOC103423592 isoform X1 [Malus domestica]
MECGEHEEFQLNLVAKVGKFLFHRTPSMNLESIREGLDTETLIKLKKSFYANVPLSYKENIVKEVVPKICVELKGKNELYYVKLSDSRRPKSIITCKCSVAKEHGKLQLCKMELDPLRYMVTNIPCLNKNLDLRLMLCTKKIVTAFADDEMQYIRDVISSAILDSNVKGGRVEMATRESVFWRPV